MADKLVIKPVILLLLVFLIMGCASPQPVLYPNSHLAAAGQEIARQDIKKCMELAKAAGAGDDKLEDAARYTAIGAASGAATGAVVGAVTGHAGRGAAAGGAGGATAGLTHSLLKSATPNAVFRNFTDRCLRDKGYEPVGWN